MQFQAKTKEEKIKIYGKWRNFKQACAIFLLQKNIEQPDVHIWHIWRPRAPPHSDLISKKSDRR